jgi:hypothetical protein
MVVQTRNPVAADTEPNLAATSPISLAHPLAKPWAVLAVVMLGTFMATLDASIVNISLPTIAHAFGEPLSGTIEWVVIGYLGVVTALVRGSERPARANVGR